MTTGLSSTIKAPARQILKSNDQQKASADNGVFKISVFSKHLQWLNYAEMAQVAAQIGFDGIDITVRPDGHVLPERVVEDLPKAVNAVRKAGLNVYMITTSIKDADDLHTENILKTASSLGITHYRMGWYNYSAQKNVEDNLKDIEVQLTKLAALNKKYSINGEYQNHSGEYFGAPIWDLYTVLKHINSPWIGSQYDIFHATVEGANSWPIGLKLLKPYIKSIDIKDFQWTKKEGKWIADVVPLGEGLVDYKNYLSALKLYGINVPISMHFEYALGGAEHGKTTLTIPRDEVIKAMQTDLTNFRTMLRTSGLVE
jgi:sugar phosphate isomerase/epimerase